MRLKTWASSSSRTSPGVSGGDGPRRRDCNRTFATAAAGAATKMSRKAGVFACNHGRHQRDQTLRRSKEDSNRRSLSGPSRSFRRNRRKGRSRRRHQSCGDLGFESPLLQHGVIGGRSRGQSHRWRRLRAVGTSASASPASQICSRSPGSVRIPFPPLLGIEVFSNDRIDSFKPVSRGKAPH